MAQPRGYVDSQYLQTIGDALREDKQRTYTLMQIQLGHHVLDLGCGPGTDTIPLAQLVGSSGRVAGVDYDPAMIAEADQRASQADVADRVRHYQADATALPLEPDLFDACRSERVFHHLPDPEAALREMVRVTKRGGRVVVLDTDWGTLSIDTPETELEGRWVRYHAERFLQNGLSGRTLYRLFTQQGLADITIELRSHCYTDWPLVRYGIDWDERGRAAVADGVLTADERERLEHSFDTAAAKGVFFASISLILVAGRKP